MLNKFIFGGISLSSIFSTTVFSGELAPKIQIDIAEPKSELELPPIELIKIRTFQTGEMDFDTGPGSLSFTQSGFRSFFIEPIEIAEGLVYLPQLSYYITSLDFDGDSTFPAQDEDLQDTSLHSFFIKSSPNSPWSGIAWNRVKFSSDFQNPNRSSFTFDVALAAGYKFSEKLTVFAGGAVTSINNEVKIFPGINFDWKVSDHFQVGLYGPNFLASYKVNDIWKLSIRGETRSTNLGFNDADNQARTLDLDSYAIGLYTENNVFSDFWVSAGAGYTVGNSIERRGNNGGGATKSNLDSAPFLQLSFSLRR